MATANECARQAMERAIRILQRAIQEPGITDPFIVMDLYGVIADLERALEEMPALTFDPRK